MVMSPPNTRAAVGSNLEKDKAVSSPAQQQQQRGQKKQRGQTASRPQSSSSCSSAADGVPVAMATHSQVAEALEALLLSDDFCDRFAARLEDRLRDSLCETVSAALEGRLEAAVKRIDELSLENQALRSQVSQLQHNFDSRLDSLAQYQRRNNVRVSGVPEADDDDEMSTSVVAMADLLNTKLGLSIQPADIDRCHRVGRRPGPGPAPSQRPPRQVLIKFVSYQQRSGVISTRHKLKNTGISIHEDLTKPRHLFLRQMADKVGFRNVWSRDGRVIWKENGRIFTQSFNSPNDGMQPENS